MLFGYSVYIKLSVYETVMVGLLPEIENQFSIFFAVVPEIASYKTFNCACFDVACPL